MSRYVPPSARQTLTRIVDGTAPWVAIGDFVDGWNRSDLRARDEMILEPLSAADSEELLRWAALIASAVDWLALVPVPRVAPAHASTGRYPLAVQAAQHLRRRQDPGPSLRLARPQAGPRVRSRHAARHRST